MNALWMDTPQRGNEHIARGRAKRHPGNHTSTIPAPCKGKSIRIYGCVGCKYLIINAFALSGRMGN